MPGILDGPRSVEVWAGIECTVNRVGDLFIDQLNKNGHGDRIEDLDLIASLGIKTLRYPVLWERTALTTPDDCNWEWADSRINRLRELGIEPIVGLVHHGSGPSYTSLVDPGFPKLLAEYAGRVAARYPHLRYFTPVNEPLTTARFSGLYGFWYPHARNDRSFARALLNQCRAVVLSMQSIRAVNPQAKLVQTEDLGKTFSTPRLAYQADFENERRWLTFDLLCGRVGRNHRLWKYLLKTGISQRELEWFQQNKCEPDIIGINHYLTSERFLDERLDRYPVATHGGNGKHVYADVEAVRVCAEGPAGPRVLLRETWQRYGQPIAVTEAHLGCTREEQMRWFHEVWDSANELASEGVDIRAVTAWSLFGAFDWNSLLTKENGHYEPGVFDIRGKAPRPTALARMISRLARGERVEDPVLSTPGWWRRLDRLIYPPERRRDHLPASSVHGVNIHGGDVQPILITGATGTLGRAFARLCDIRGIPYRLTNRKELDIGDIESVQKVLGDVRPWAVINAAGYVRVDDAESDKDRCYRENSYGPENLAGACADAHLRLVTFSSDLVFDGSKREPYLESDAVAPLGHYGVSKAEAERRVLEILPEALVVRTSAFFGPWDEYNFVTTTLKRLARKEKVQAIADCTVSPTYVPDLVQATLDLLIDGEGGLIHLANQGHTTWSQLARTAAAVAGLDAGLVEDIPVHMLALPAARPKYCALGSERGNLLPELDSALTRYIGEVRDAIGLRVEQTSRRARAASGSGG